MFSLGLKQPVNLKGLQLPFSPSVLNEKLPPFVNIGLLFAVSYALANMTWGLLGASEPRVAPPLASNKTGAMQITHSKAPLLNIAQLHLFGEVPRNQPRSIPVPELDVPIDAPDTKLRLTLKGVFSSSDPNSAWAIIADRVGKEDSYGIDSPLPGGAILKEIHNDRILLLHDNRFETLRLPKDQINKGSNRFASNNRGTTSRRSNSRRNSSSRNTRSNRVSTRVTPEVSDTIRGYRDALLNDPQSVMDVVRAEPYRKGGRLQGYRIFPGRDKRILGDIGLRSGDVVTAVNGIELDSPLKGLEIMQNISSATDISVDVLRNGVPQSFSVPLN